MEVLEPANIGGEKREEKRARVMNRQIGRQPFSDFKFLPVFDAFTNNADVSIWQDVEYHPALLIQTEQPYLSCPSPKTAECVHQLIWTGKNAAEQWTIYAVSGLQMCNREHPRIEGLKVGLSNRNPSRHEINRHRFHRLAASVVCRLAG